VTILYSGTHYFMLWCCGVFLKVNIEIEIW
jgi:hypothetical protein